MDDAERSERKEIRKPRIPASTSALSHAMSAVDLPDAVLICATSLTPRSVLVSCIDSLATRFLTEVSAVSMVDSTSGFSTTPLRPVYCGSDAFHRVVLGGHQAQPTSSPLQYCGSTWCRQISSARAKGRQSCSEVARPIGRVLGLLSARPSTDHHSGPAQLRLGAYWLSASARR